MNYYHTNLSTMEQNTTIDPYSTLMLNDSSMSVANDTWVRPTIVPYSERPASIIVPIIFLLIFIVGLIGNGALILIFVRHRLIRNAPNTYILSLAVGDLFVIISSVPFTSTMYTIETWPYGEMICKISEFAKDLSTGVSVFTLTALSADRFFAIVDPLKKLHSSIGGRRASKFTRWVTISVWVFSVLCALPAAILSHLKAITYGNVTLFEVCYAYPDTWIEDYPRMAITAKFFVYYTIPLIIIAFFYLMMARHLIRSARNLPGEVQGHLRQIKARRKVAKTVLAFVIIFALCFLPQHLFLLWFYYSPTAEDDYNDFWNIFHIVGFCLGFLNSCVNPVALYFVSGSFRQYYNEYLYILCGRPRSREECRERTTNNIATRIGYSSGYGLTETTRRDRNSPTVILMNELTKPDLIITMGESTVTTLVNGIETKDQLM